MIAPHIASASDAVVAGTVIRLQGAAFANHSDSSDNLHKGRPVLVGDHIVTGHDSRVLLKMVDGAMLTLGADTEFVISDYHFSKKAQQGSATLKLVKGVFRAVTGAIGKLKGRDFKVKTSLATIGIRGTDFWGGFYFSQGLDVALLDGKGIYVENAAGRVEVTSIGDGTTINSATEPPTAPKHWGDKKLNAAKQSVALKMDAQP
ncbi:MAG: FecR domain-containing protein [Gallionella sp.]